MDGLLRLGKEKRSVNGILHNATKQKKGLVEEVENENEAKLEDERKETNDDGEEQDKGKSTLMTISSQLSQSQFTKSSERLCAICRIRSSSYTCPQCNIPYCSSACFRDVKHERCSKPFAKQALEEERKLREDEEAERGGGGGFVVDEQEREKMMDILKRLKSLDTNVKSASSRAAKPKLGKFRSSENGNENEIIDDQSEEEEEGSEWEDDISQKAQKLGIDLDTADTQELLAMLNAEERKRFQTIIRKAELNGGQIDDETDEFKVEREDQERTKMKSKWWNLSDLDGKDQIGPEVSKKFSKDVDTIMKGMQKNGKELQWNILSVVLSYVYIVRHLDRDSLGTAVRDGAEENVELEFIKNLFRQLVPFLIPDQTLDKPVPLSKTLLSNAEEVTLWLVAKLGKDAGQRPAEMMQFLLKEIRQNFLSNAKVYLEEDEKESKMMVCLSDIYNIASKPDRKKIAFYAAYWNRFIISDDYTNLIKEVQLELDRLKTEIKRTEDEERWRAAHEAMESHGGVVIPS